LPDSLDLLLDPVSDGSRAGQLEAPLGDQPSAGHFPHRQLDFELNPLVELGKPESPCHRLHSAACGPAAARSGAPFTERRQRPAHALAGTLAETTVHQRHFVQLPVARRMGSDT